MREAVLEVSDYFDGPRTGVALFQGVPHRFRSRYLDASEYGEGSEAEDLFELVPISSPSAPRVLAHATFHVMPEQPEPPRGVLRKLEVIWRVVNESGT